MAFTRSNRTSSPTPSDSGDALWESFDDYTSPAPSQTADPLGWESDSTDASVNPDNTTPTPQGRPAAPTSVVEVSEDDFPTLVPSAPATATKPRAKTTKGKGKKKAVEEPVHISVQVRRDEDDPHLVQLIEQAKAESLGLTSSVDHLTSGASSSRHPVSEPGSPPKCMCANTTGESAPAPFTDTSAASTTTADTTVATATGSGLTPFLVPTTTPAAAAADTTNAAVPTYAAVAAAPAPAPAPAAPAPAHSGAGAPPADAAAPPPLWLTTDGLPPCGSYTPTPTGGFPGIVYSRKLLLQCYPEGLMRLNKEVDHLKLFVVVSGGNGASMHTHVQLCEVIGGYLNIDPAGFTLGTPPTAHNGTSPALWLVADLPNNLAQALINKSVISSTNITFYPIPYAMPIIGFGATLALRFLRTVITESSEITQFVQTHRDTFGPQVSAAQAWETFLASIVVSSIVLLDNDICTVAWRLYVNPPTNNHEIWALLRRLFAKLSIMNAKYCTACLMKRIRCRICPAIDDLTGLCPLPHVPGWLGPTAATITALEEAGRAATAKAQERNSSAVASGSCSNAGNGRAPNNNKSHFDGKGKKGGDFKGKGKHHDDFY
ncbi:hypothetical protein C8J57DRAFT_1532098 [Mycena rebaudengoi]|nr:hypothetical protein C8J57DRAFT_1532098 [Mycena rebaudengoi]